MPGIPRRNDLGSRLDRLERAVSALERITVSTSDTGDDGGNNGGGDWAGSGATFGGTESITGAVSFDHTVYVEVPDGAVMASVAAVSTITAAAPAAGTVITGHTEIEGLQGFSTATTATGEGPETLTTVQQLDISASESLPVVIHAEAGAAMDWTISTTVVVIFT